MIENDWTWQWIAFLALVAFMVFGIMEAYQSGYRDGYKDSHSLHNGRIHQQVL